MQALNHGAPRKALRAFMLGEEDLGHAAGAQGADQLITPTDKFAHLSFSASLETLAIIGRLEFGVNSAWADINQGKGFLDLQYPSISALP